MVVGIANSLVAERLAVRISAGAKNFLFLQKVKEAICPKYSVLSRD